jgi:hypothetical protein
VQYCDIMLVYNEPNTVTNVYRVDLFPPSKVSNENLQIILNSPFLVTLLIDFTFSSPIYTLTVNENQLFKPVQ